MIMNGLGLEIKIELPKSFSRFNEFYKCIANLLAIHFFNVDPSFVQTQILHECNIRMFACCFRYQKMSEHFTRKKTIKREREKKISY